MAPRVVHTVLHNEQAFVLDYGRFGVATLRSDVDVFPEVMYFAQCRDEQDASPPPPYEVWMLGPRVFGADTIHETGIATADFYLLAPTGPGVDLWDISRGVAPQKEVSATTEALTEAWLVYEAAVRNLWAEYDNATLDGLIDARSLRSRIVEYIWAVQRAEDACGPRGSQRWEGEEKEARALLWGIDTRLAPLIEGTVWEGA